MLNKLSVAIKTANQKSFLRKTALLTTSAATLAMMSMVPGVSAQEGAAPVEEIMITGIRGSLKAAIDVKRNSASVVDAISAEDIGKMPDKNLAESLQRVPGVTINRGFTGEGNEVSVRGVNPELTSVLLNGNYVATTGWFSQTASKRSFNMDLLPSELVKKVEVHKSPTASLDEGGVGGTVIVETRKPLELDANTIYGSIEGMQNTLASGETGGGATGMYSWKNEGETFGVLVAASTLKTLGRANKAENYWEDGWSASGISEFNQDRVRDVFDITGQFKATDELTFTGHYLSTEIDAENTNQNFLFINSHWRDGVQNQNATVPGTASSDETPAGLPFAGEFTSGSFLAQDINSRQAKIKSEVADVKFEFEGEGFSMNGTLGKTESDGGNGGNINTLWGISGYNGATTPVGTTPGFMINGKPVTVNIDMRPKDKMQLAPNLPDGLTAADGSWQLFQDGPSRAVTLLNDEETYAQFDTQFDVEFGAINQLEAGIKLRQHEFTNDKVDYRYVGTAFANSTLADFQDGVIEHSGEGLFGGSPTKIARADAGKIRAAFMAGQQAGVADRAAYGNVEEDIKAIYTQANFEGEGYAGNVGIRYVETDVTGTAYTPKAQINTTIAGVKTYTNPAETTSIDGSYSDFLPSLNLKVDLSDDVIARFSAARVMSRAGYSAMSPSITSSSETSRKAARGNPTIDPFRATQMDMGIEWYFAEDALASAALFTKDIGSFITTGQVIQPLQDTNGTFDYVVDVPVQGRGGKIQGVELQYQQTFGNFGTIANLTYVDGSGSNDQGQKMDLPGTSRVAYNLTGYYEQELFSVRLAYTHRSEFLAEGLGIGGAEFYAPQDFLDASAVFHATSNIDISFDVQNVLGEVTSSYIPKTGNTSGEVLRISNDNGTRYYLKAALKF